MRETERTKKQGNQGKIRLQQHIAEQGKTEHNKVRPGDDRAEQSKDKEGQSKTEQE